MTVSSVVPRVAGHDSSLGRFQRVGLVAVVVLGPLSVTVLRAVLPYHAADDSATIATTVADHSTVQSLVLWLTLTAALTLVPAVITVGLLAARHSRGLATWGMALAVAGFSLLFATTVVDFTALAGAESGIGRDATTRLLDALTTSLTQTVAVTGFVVGHILGLVLLGAALLRGRVIPAWAAWALILSQPLHVVFAVIVPANTLDAAAWALTTIAFATAATAIGRPVRSSR